MCYENDAPVTKEQSSAFVNLLCDTPGISNRSRITRSEVKNLFLENSLQSVQDLLRSLPAKIAQRPPKSPQQVEGDLIGILKGVRDLSKSQLKTAIKEMQRLDYAPISEI